MAKKPLDDAWKQFHDLLDKYTKVTEVRSDIAVHGRACDRAVELILRRENPSGKILDPKRYSYQSTGPRNVSTMRELALAILDACDFVDEGNPTWASRHVDLTDREREREAAYKASKNGT